jgi:hypothetical protein
MRSAGTRETTVAVTAGISEETLGHLQALAQESGRAAPEIASRAIDEYVRSARFLGIHFCDTPTGERKAVLRSGHSVWGIVFNAHGFGMDPEKTAQHLQIPVESVRLALDYYTAYPREIDEHLRALEEFAEEPERFSPSVRILNMPDEADAASP